MVRLHAIRVRRLAVSLGEFHRKVLLSGLLRPCMVPQQKALATVEYPLNWWKCYMDDTHTILNKEHGQAVPKHLNMVDDDTKRTIAGDIVIDEIRVDTQEEVGNGVE